MATSDVPTLYGELEWVFDQQDPPARWDDYHVVPVDIEETDAAVSGKTRDRDDLEDAVMSLPLEQSSWVGQTESLSFSKYEEAPVEVAVTFPGSPHGSGGIDYPSPDSFAFYLPFHYFYPDLWGVFIVTERLRGLWRGLQMISDYELSDAEAYRAARFFLYYHEAFHHNVESFATRLEVTHRQAVYRTGVQQVFEDTFGTDDCLEEALANAYAFRRTIKKFSKKTEVVSSVLRAYIEGQPEGYRRGVDYIEDEAYHAARRKLSEAFHNASFPSLIDRRPKIWSLFGHGYRGIANINSYTNYLISKDSPLSDRKDLHGRRIGYRGVKNNLEELVGLRFKRKGKGNHEIYETDDGNSVTLYYTTGDVPKGTLSEILKQARVNMTVYDFLRM
jgi:predicted RNA binding protein YcfA (HicA-like mRNA interferase family)